MEADHENLGIRVGNEFVGGFRSDEPLIYTNFEEFTVLYFNTIQLLHRHASMSPPGEIHNFSLGN